MKGVNIIMVIEYEINKFVTEKCKIEIEDSKNIFLKGQNPYDGLSTYFGIWTTEKYIVIATIISNKNISYEYSLDKNIYTTIDIKKYLEFNRNVQVITKNEFKEQLKSFLSVVKM